MIKSPLDNADGELHVDGISAMRLAEEFGTPLYVMLENRIRGNYQSLYSASSRRYAKTRLLYSAKANTNLSVLRILKSEGAWVDTVSPGEVFLALRAGFLPQQILYTGTSVRDDELRYLLENGAMINADSVSQAERLLRIGIPSVMSMRINPGVGAGHHKHVVTGGEVTKFGVYEEPALKAYELAKNAGVKRFGIQMHIGSGIMDVTFYVRAAEKLLSIARNIHEHLGVDFDFIDLGGGIGVPYRPEEKEVNLEQFFDKMIHFLREKTEEYSLGEPEFWFEPGRYLVAEAGILLTRVNTIKATASKRFAGVDAGFNTLIRPAFYGSYHHILVANRLNEPLTEEYDVVGPLCESGDVLAGGRLLPRLSEGDLLAILNAGAYGYSMSSQYNSRPRPAEVLVKDGRYELIRKSETLDDLFSGQEVASWLKN